MKQPYLPIAGLLGLIAAQPLAAQDLTNTGAIISVGNGATLYVSGSVANTSGTLQNNGTVQVDGALQNAGTLDLGTGTLAVKGNLTNTGTVTPGTGEVVLTGTGTQTLTPGGASIYKLTVNNTAAAGSNIVSVPADLTLLSQLALTAGIVQTAPGAKIIVPNGATVTGEAAGRYVKGNLQVTRTGLNGSSAVDFGNGATLNPNGNNLPQVTITRSAGLSTANVTYGTDPQNPAAKGIDRIWTVDLGTTPATPASLTLNWVADDDNGLTNFSQARVWRQLTASAPWERVGTLTNASPAGPSPRTITVNATNSARFTVSNTSNPLPVELLRFTAERKAADAVLRWATASEKNNDHFDVEVSIDGKEFKHLGRVAGHGTTTSESEYQYLDAQIIRHAAPLLYYRLRQVDTNGQEQLSPVRTLQVEGEFGFAAQAWPNPFGSKFDVEIRTTQAGPVDLTLRDAVGRTLLSRRLEVLQGTSTFSLTEAGKLPQGVYLLSVQQQKHRAVIKITRE
ncbi:T9SS type A sorting domain-containing protein [Hymenobacter busanensis]|uniref:T9SS type A sorting domain-containing protein n=1 Tax=Hymenobacter busanensis TaxID=2607656 RepID=A0A7L4ZY46_9BACT|nr:T9SS type A sorting domain-containing protein [Hymenobacter busanensis]KAA9339883.1 T9SS type A sorting domain-containing protein [Hymenobacter busanensis]QHJ06360.1 T9SS type A sorting domain-containing protein [Hymenobacter busanensis]